MNIRAAMAVLELDDLDLAAKMALLVLACRADQHTGMVRVSTPRLAADMGVHYATAWRALGRLTEAGYVLVDNSPGRTSLRMLTPRVVQGVTPRAVQSDPSRSAKEPLAQREQKEYLEKREGPGTRAPHFAPGSGLIVDFTSRRNGDHR